MVSPARQARADRKGQTRRVGQRRVKHEVSLRVHRNSAAGLRGRAAGEGQVGNARSTGCRGLSRSSVPAHASHSVTPARGGSGPGEGPRASWACAGAERPGGAPGGGSPVPPRGRGSALGRLPRRGPRPARSSRPQSPAAPGGRRAHGPAPRRPPSGGRTGAASAPDEHRPANAHWLEGAKRNTRATRARCASSGPFQLVTKPASTDRTAAEPGLLPRPRLREPSAPCFTAVQPAGPRRGVARALRTRGAGRAAGGAGACAWLCPDELSGRGQENHKKPSRSSPEGGQGPPRSAKLGSPAEPGADAKSPPPPRGAVASRLPGIRSLRCRGRRVTGTPHTCLHRTAPELVGSASGP